MSARYYAPTGGHPGQDQLLTDRAMFTEAYAVLPRGTMRDIVVSFLPHWALTRLWVLARPLSGFAETFSQYLVEVLQNGGSDRPESDPAAEAVLFVVDPARLHHRNPITPYAGRELTGVVRSTWLRGQRIDLITPRGRLLVRGAA